VEGNWLSSRFRGSVRVNKTCKSRPSDKYRMTQGPLGWKFNKAEPSLGLMKAQGTFRLGFVLDAVENYTERSLPGTTAHQINGF
jgi:hypothetical protein